MGQSVAVMLFTANALLGWALVVQALRLGSRHGAGVFVAMGATLALLTTVMLVQAQVTNHDAVVALVRVQLALRTVMPALWLIALIRWAAPPFIHRAHMVIIAIPALAFATAALVTPVGGPMLEAVTRSPDSTWALDITLGPWVHYVSLPVGFLMLGTALAVIALTPLQGRGIGRGAMVGWFSATALVLVTSVVQAVGWSPLPGYSATGVVIGVMVVVLHVTLATTPAFARRERAFRAAFEAMHEPALVVAADGTILEANPSASELLGEGEALSGSNLTALAPQLEKARRAAGGSTVGHPLQGDMTGFEVSITGARMSVGTSPASVLVLHDRRRERAREAHLMERSNRDPLTDALNRRGFEDALGQALERRGGSAVGLIYIDLDGFKAINDTLGHAAGDAVLVEVAGRLQSVVRAGDSVARLGGDEFAMVLVDTTPAGLAAVAERATMVVARPIDTVSGPATVASSFGVAAAPGDGTTVDALVRAADERMYRRKDAKSDRPVRATMSGIALEPPSPS
ncbi:MAG: diguanylate cyclase [Trueperaceae bacterium]|nr:MAG: diguanylate cyclase [Trueperaceae bacterium]